MDSIKLEFVRSSKNYHVYAVMSDDVLPDKIYIRQTALGPNPPAVLTLTLAADGQQPA